MSGTDDNVLEVPTVSESIDSVHDGFEFTDCECIISYRSNNNYDIDDYDIDNESLCDRL